MYKILFFLLLSSLFINIFCFNYISKYKQVKYPQVNNHIVITTPNVIIKPEYLTKWKTLIKTITINKEIAEFVTITVDNIIITTDDSYIQAEILQNELNNFLGSPLEITINRLNKDEIETEVFLNYVGWKKTIKLPPYIEEPKVEEKEQDIFIGANYLINNGFEINFNKKIGILPIVDIPYSLGLSYKL